MKLLGLQRIDGGIVVALPSGQQLLVALPEDRRSAAEVVGQRVLALLDDPDEPHSPGGCAPAASIDDPEDEDPLAALDAGLEAGRLVWRALQRVSRGRGR